MIKGAIFDFNGTLFWDTELHNQAWDTYLGRFNINLSSEEKHLKLHGKNNFQLIHDLFDVELSNEAINKIAHEKELLYQDLVKDRKLQLADGVTEMLETLQNRKIPFTIVTASDKLNIDFFFEYLGLEKWFDRKKLVFADGSLKPKPHPDMFLKAMELLQIQASETIIFEDSETGLVAASQAKAGKIVVVDSTLRESNDWPYEVIDSFLGWQRFFP